MKIPRNFVAIMDQCEITKDAHCEHKLCWYIVQVYWNEASLLDKLMADSFKTPSSELIDIAVNHLAIQQANEQVSNSTKLIDAIWQNKQQSGQRWGRHGHTQPSYPKCGNCTRCYQPGRAHTLPRIQSAWIATKLAIGSLSAKTITQDRWSIERST